MKKCRYDIDLYPPSEEKEEYQNVTIPTIDAPLIAFRSATGVFVESSLPFTLYTTTTEEEAV